MQNFHVLKTLIRGYFIRKKPVKNVNVCFVPKRLTGDRKPWIRFGSSKSKYEKWIPEEGVFHYPLLDLAYDLGLDGNNSPFFSPLNFRGILL